MPLPSGPLVWTRSAGSGHLLSPQEQPSMGNSMWRGLGTGHCCCEYYSLSPYLVLVNIFIPGNNDSLLDPRLRKPSFHSLQWERKARSAVGAPVAAAATGELTKDPFRAQLEAAVTFSPGSLRFFLFWFWDFRLQILPEGHHCPNYKLPPVGLSSPDHMLPLSPWLVILLPSCLGTS